MAALLKKIVMKSYSSREALKKAIQAFLDEHPGSDELDVANGVRRGLQETSEAIDELVAEGRVESLKR